MYKINNFKNIKNQSEPVTMIPIKRLNTATRILCIIVNPWLGVYLFTSSKISEA